MYKIEGQWGDETVITKESTPRVEYRVIPSQASEGKFVLSKRDSEVGHGTVWAKYLDGNGQWVSKESNVLAKLKEFDSIEAVLGFLQGN